METLLFCVLGRGKEAMALLSPTPKQDAKVLLFPKNDSARCPEPERNICGDKIIWQIMAPDIEVSLPSLS